MKSGAIPTSNEKISFTWTDSKTQKNLFKRWSIKPTAAKFTYVKYLSFQYDESRNKSGPKSAEESINKESMKKEDKQLIIDQLQQYQEYNFYLVISLHWMQRRQAHLKKCSKQDIKLVVVKHLVAKELESSMWTMKSYPVLKGNTAIMFSNVANAPAKLIDKYKADKIPAFKGAYVQESIFVGPKALQDLINIKSKTELIGDVIALLQSPAKNLVSALQSGGTILHGVLKTLSEKDN